MVSPVIAIIGAGNMGNSLIGGLIKNNHPVDRLWAADPDEKKCAYLQQFYGIHTTTDNAAAIQAAEVIIFAIKPQIFAAVAKPLQELIQQRKPLIITIAAGIPVASIQQWLGGDLAIVRAMPNTPALISTGATALFANTHVAPEQHDIAESILRAVGITEWLLSEHLIDIVTALSGSGPAYFFLVMEALQQTAIELGLPAATARILTLQTALGAARMAIESGTPLDELRLQVTSPGGTTEKAISVLEENNLRHVFKQALVAAKCRSEELAELLGEKK